MRGKAQEQGAKEAQREGKNSVTTLDPRLRCLCYRGDSAFRSFALDDGWWDEV